MNQLFKIFCLSIITLFLYSCSSTNNMILDFPNHLITIENTVHVKGTKGKGIVGTKRNLIYNKLYSGKLKEGWTKTSDIIDKFPHGFFSKETFERSIYDNLGIEIDEVTSKTSDKFQFSLTDSTQTWIAFCSQQYEGKSTRYDIQNKIDFSKAKSQKSDFEVTLINLTDTTRTNWKLELKYNRKTPNGIISAFIKEGMATETGQLSNGKDTIVIKPLFVKGKKLENNEYAKIIKIVGGYEFILNNKTIGIVDLYKQTINLFDTNSKYNPITTITATSLLLRKR